MTNIETDESRTKGTPPRQKNPQTKAAPQLRTQSDDDICETFDIDSRTLYRWIAKGCPCTGKGQDRRWDEAEVAAWMKSNGLQGKLGRPGDSTDPTDPLVIARTRKEIALARKHELAVEKLRAKLIDRDQADRDNAAKYALIRNKCRSISAGLAKALVGQSPTEIERMIDERVNQVLTELSRM